MTSGIEVFNFNKSSINCISFLLFFLFFVSISSSLEKSLSEITFLISSLLILYSKEDSSEVDSPPLILLLSFSSFSFLGISDFSRNILL